MDPLLVESGLFGRGLVTIDTPEGIERYNDALADLGCGKTALTTINVDGIGWSPEVAVEQGNKAYLCHGPSNQCGIIVSPDQDRKPIHVPEHTFLRPVMREWFRRSKREAADATTSACIRITFDQGTSGYESAKDMLYIDRITVQSSAGAISEQAQAQRELARRFTSEPNAFLDASLRASIIDAGKQYGDLRKRHLEIPELAVAQIEDFWSRAFGGVFVLTAGRDKILIVEDESLLPGLAPDKGERYTVFSLNQRREIVTHLIEEDLIECDPKFYKDRPDELTNLKMYLAADFICRVEPDCDLHSMSAGRRSAVMNAHKADQPHVFQQLERFQRSLSGKLGNKQVRVPDDLGMLLLRPTMRAGDSAHPILRMLLLRLQENPADLMRFYRYDKERFFALFETWSPAKKRWAANYIKGQYKPEMEKH